MPNTTANKITVPINSDAYNLTPDLTTMANSTNVVIPVASLTERNALTPVMGKTMVIRNDLAYSPVERYDGAGVWRLMGTQNSRWNRNAGSDNTFTSANTNLVSGTITNASVGYWRVEGFLGLYGSSSAGGRVFVSTGSSPTYDKRRQDITSTPGTYYVATVYYHSGGDLVMNAGYDVTTGTAAVMSGASGDSSLIATFLGN